MGITTFIGHRFVRVYKGSFSGPVIRIATAGIAMSVAVMIISVVIVKGFQLEIRNKVIGYSGHIRVKPFQTSAVDQQVALQFDREDIVQIKNHTSGIISLHPTAERSGIIKTENQIEGCIFKGVNHEYYKDFIEEAMVEGHFPDIRPEMVSNEVAISKITATRMQLNTGDVLRMYFLLPGENQPRGRRLTISGIFDTGLSEFDKKYMFGDLGHIQQLNRWAANETGLLEVLIDKYDQMDKMTRMLALNLDYDLEVWNVRELFPDIFNWLDLLDMNVIVIIVIMMVVAMINIITILLIRILEKTSAIGIMKSFGASNMRIRRIFQYISLVVLLKGLLIGNAIGFMIAFLQSRFHLMSLDQDTYYVSTVPVYFDWLSLLTVNFIVFVSGMIFMVLPSMIISRIYPAQTLRLK